MEKEIIKGNKLIADFMGILTEIKFNDLRTSKHFGDKLVIYHTSWDWLMPVVEKINKWHIGNECKKMDLYILQLSICSSIDMVWDATVQFITWYNQINSTPPKK